MFLSTRNIHAKCLQNHINAKDRRRKSLYSSPLFPPGTFPTLITPRASNISLHQDPTRFKVESKRRQTPGPIALFAASGEKFDQRFSGRPRLSATFCSSQQGLTSAVPGCHVIVWLHLVQSICSSRLLTVRRQRAVLRGPADT